MSDLGQSRKNHYPNFDVVRLLLALEVVVAHAWWKISPEGSWSGFIMAVPAFLAVSGFLVLKSYSDSGSLIAFAKKRALRIFPALIASLLLCYVLFGWPAVTNSLVTWITGGIYDPSGITNSPLWSLAWEELAYLMLAALWALGAYKRPAWIWVLLAISWTISWKITHIPLTPYVQILSFLAPAFFTGNLAFIYRDRLFRFGSILPWILFTVVVLWKVIPHPKFLGIAAPPVLQAFAMVWAGMAGAKIIHFKIPDISYSLYIYHMPILLFIIGPCGITSPVIASITLTLTLIPVCLFSWHFIEGPALKLKNRNRPVVAHISDTTIA